jgi:hypothetical protein
MVRFATAAGALVALGAVVAVAFGAAALFVYAFFALLAVGTAIAVGLGGNVITAWSRRRIEESQRHPHERR